MINTEKIEKKVKIIFDSSVGSTRVDKFLSEHFSDFSRSFFQKLMDKQLIWVNGKAVKSSYSLKMGDEITVNFPEIKEFDLSAKKVDFGVVDTQEDFVVVNKPAGLIVHPSGKTQEDEITLVNGLLYYFKELNKFDNKERPGIVHRIDKDTSGLLLVAKNMHSQMKISKMFKDRLMHKTYLAVVKGHPAKKGKIDFSIGRHPYKKHMMSHVSYNGRKALTYYQVLAYYKDCSLVAVRIVTGRTHQIRVHFAAIGHGLLGDEVYGVKSKSISRQALHAWKLSFEYNDKKYNYYQVVPKDFKKLLKILNQNNS